MWEYWVVAATAVVVAEIARSARLSVAGRQLPVAAAAVDAESVGMTPLKYLSTWKQMDPPSFDCAVDSWVEAPPQIVVGRTVAAAESVVVAADEATVVGVWETSETFGGGEIEREFGEHDAETVVAAAAVASALRVAADGWMLENHDCLPLRIVPSWRPTAAADDAGDACPECCFVAERRQQLLLHACCAGRIVTAAAETDVVLLLQYRLWSAAAAR